MTNNNLETHQKKRKLLDGSEVNDYDYPIDLILHTKAPGKWKLIDLGKTFDITNAINIFQDYIDRKDFNLQILMCNFFRIEYSEVNSKEILVQQFKFK